jgi:hypothetical protein
MINCIYWRTPDFYQRYFHFIGDIHFLLPIIQFYPADIGCMNIKLYQKKDWLQ